MAQGCTESVSRLQRGRGRETAESIVVVEVIIWPPMRFNGAAVVRPRRAREKLISRDLRWGFNGAAVVRPRRERWLYTGVTRAKSLQRGRGRETAERRRREAARCSWHWLQRGRGRETAESSAQQRQSTSQRGCFNGAAVVRPRRGSVVKGIHPATKNASTGPRS